MNLPPSRAGHREPSRVIIRNDNMDVPERSPSQELGLHSRSVHSPFDD